MTEGLLDIRPDATIVRTVEVASGINVDLDAHGQVVAVENINGPVTFDDLKTALAALPL